MTWSNNYEDYTCSNCGGKINYVGRNEFDPWYKCVDCNKFFDSLCDLKPIKGGYHE